jgi:hypothetical protein
MAFPVRYCCLAALALTMTPPARSQETYRGMCDASAAVALAGGRFVVADDESDVLRIYKRGTAREVAHVDLVDFLGNRKPNGKGAEADIEGAARIGNRIYWISSHARKGSDGELAPHRQRLFATDVVASGSMVIQAGRPVESLLADLLADVRFDVLVAAAQRKPEDEDGLNIEGLADDGAGGLLIGFRNPLPQGRALVVPLLNPRDVVDSGAKPRFGDLVRLDLGGRGIRSLERVGVDLLIAAGPYGTAAASTVKPAFALFRWSGNAADAPKLLRGLDDGSFRTEALFHDPADHALVLLSDDGDELVAGKECKGKSVSPDARSFRARVIAWPFATTSLRPLKETVPAEK